MTKLAVKINVSSLQVLKTLLLLMSDNYTMNELVDRLNKNNDGFVFNNNVVSKYINSCRYCGIEILKIQGKYYVTNLPFGLDFSILDINLLQNLQQISHTLFSAQKEEMFNEFLAKLNKFSNKKIANVQNKNNDEINKKFKEAIALKRKVNLTLRTRDCIECFPIGITKNKNKIFYNVYKDFEEKLIAVDRIVAIEILDKKFQKNFSDVTVIFKIKGNLKDRYTLKDNEQIVDTKEDYIAISNKGEIKDILFSRLLRYDSCCEILSPTSYREEMKSIIRNTLSNYGVNK